MIRIGAGNKRRNQGPDTVRGRRRLRPWVMALEGRELLSTLTVSNTDDSGAGSLRAAVAQADADGGGDTIVFSSLFNSPHTIALTGGQLELTGTKAPTTITGPGAERTVGQRQQRLPGLQHRGRVGGDLGADSQRR